MRINEVKAQKCLEQCPAHDESPVNINGGDDENTEYKASHLTGI